MEDQARRGFTWWNGILTCPEKYADLEQMEINRLNDINDEYKCNGYTDKSTGQHAGKLS